MRDNNRIFFYQPRLHLFPQLLLLGRAQLLLRLIIQVVLHLLADYFQFVGG